MVQVPDPEDDIREGIRVGAEVGIVPVAGQPPIRPVGCQGEQSCPRRRRPIQRRQVGPQEAEPVRPTQTIVGAAEHAQMVRRHQPGRCRAHSGSPQIQEKVLGAQLGSSTWTVDSVLPRAHSTSGQKACPPGRRPVRGLQVPEDPLNELAALRRSTSRGTPAHQLCLTKPATNTAAEPTARSRD
jgi:hypothetical protein